MAAIVSAELQNNLQTGTVMGFQGAVLAFAQAVKVDASGLQLNVNWPNIAGATSVELESASLTLSPNHTALGPSLGSFTGKSETTELDITLPAPRLVRSIKLNDFEVNFDGEYTRVRNQSDLGGYRIAVALWEGDRFGAPVVSVPPTSTRGAIPPLLTGGSFSNSVLYLPDLQASKIRLMVVENGVPEDFTPIQFSVSSAVVRAAPYPSDMELLNFEDSPVWGLPGPYKDASSIDLKQAVTQGLDKALESGSPLSTHVTLKASVEGHLYHYGLNTKGQVLRKFEEKVKLSLEGGGKLLDLPGPALASTAPFKVTADVTLKHKGMRLHPLSDSLPEVLGYFQGPVVGVDPVVREWPREAFLDETLKRIGLFGHAPEETELSIRLMALSEGGGVTPLNDQWGAATVTPNNGKSDLVWIDLPDYGPIGQAVALEVKSTRGRFYWVENGAPITRVAVAHSPQPEDKIDIGSTPVEFTGMETQYLAMGLGAGSFQSAPPLVKSDQFTDVVLTNLTLRYRS